jgi:hypothetical protein
MAGLLALARVATFVPPQMGTAKALKSAQLLFAKNRAINPPAARVAMFGVRYALCVVSVVVGAPVPLEVPG